MALDGSELVADPFPALDTLDPVPASSPLRVSLNTQYESGIPPARMHADLSLDAGAERLELALAGVTRTEANLGQLIRGLKHLAAGAAAAREANNELMTELDELQIHLAETREEELMLRHRMAHVEQLLDVIRHESARERDFLIEQQDLFLIEIMTDHDRHVADLQRSVREAMSRKSDPSEIAEIIVQRDQAREYATRCERERDLAWQELAAGDHPTLPPPPTPTPTPASGKAGATAIGSISLRAQKVPASLMPDSERASERLTSSYSLSGEDISES